MKKSILTYVPRSWDSSFFNRCIGDVTWEKSCIHCDNSSNFDVITTRIASDDLNKKQQLQQDGFVYCEGDIGFVKQVGTQHGLPLDIATSTDLPQLLSMADNIYHHSRFIEPWFSQEERNQFYLEWLRKAVLGQFDDACLLIKDTKGNIMGYVTVKIQLDSCTIGLIGVSKDFRGTGVGSKLLTIVEDYASQHNASSINVATQTSNIPAMNLYIRNGYSVTHSNIWLYK
ncbi:GNAT family N-acetyltransferase [Vibrio clamense]|uniref:GNAT family N-acetyltransferase n=1 Tax=Vibrio clamense TaxID=2910254 RepID=UPI003D1FA1BE